MWEHQSLPSKYLFRPSPIYGGARGVIVIITGYGHGDTSSIPGQDWFHFT